jgi:hypothetical protein
VPSWPHQVFFLQYRFLRDIFKLPDTSPALQREAAARMSPLIFSPAVQTGRRRQLASMNFYRAGGTDRHAMPAAYASKTGVSDILTFPFSNSIP